MSILLIVFLILVWIMSSTYVMYTHNKSYTLSLEIIIGAILLGPILALFVGKHEHTIKKHYGVIERESNDRHRRWFQTLGLINRERTSNIRNNTPPHVYSNRTIPPPPPYTAIEPPNRRPGIKIKDFKFFQK